MTQKYISKKILFILMFLSLLIGLYLGWQIHQFWLEDSCLDMGGVISYKHHIFSCVVD